MAAIQFDGGVLLPTIGAIAMFGDDLLIEGMLQLMNNVEGDVVSVDSESPSSIDDLIRLGPARYRPSR
ncbi:hypothetical protein [Stenotrophomonas sp. SAU14A_NAIMI4_8]|uniref:hypothetical protein n=1 Tax=Stenotrophomonas sp. SAU14A_NAIMI4_8 TaxID=2072409 RepID=UPI000D541D6A|nr:hypothetical protein [Stenotrophomonas sp. SAU14A_NAIMI4_8]AWH33939.1 hypothetical protein C1930_14250 [Stenotrophomonas sp. SAU14A_NAIMI4_8]